ncbi:MAG: hypothetical protein ACTIIH_07215 [Brevibacterium sp.]|uniref:hypothetical protein n=1 Tax=Brevibacterium sp. TaxID=1701 RepID=UPI003F909346
MILVKNVRLFPRTPDAPAVDVEITEGRFSRLSPAEDAAPGPTPNGTGTTPTGAEVIDGAGRILLPSLGDVHAHLDSNRMGQTFRPHTADGTLHGYIMNDRENWRGGERSVAVQAAFAIARIVASGGTRIRSHAQVDADCGLERFYGVRAALETVSERDYWSPYGDGDLLRRTWQLAFTNGFRADADIEGCLDIASRGGAQVMAGARPDGSALAADARFGLAVGAPADFMLVDADTVTSAIMDCPQDRDVFKEGRLIASGGELTGGPRLS